MHMLLLLAAHMTYWEAPNTTLHALPGLLTQWQRDCGSLHQPCSCPFAGLVHNGSPAGKRTIFGVKEAKGYYPQYWKHSSCLDDSLQFQAFQRGLSHCCKLLLLLKNTCRCCAHIPDPRRESIFKRINGSISYRTAG